MNDTPTPIPRPKAKKNKIRPKLKPIVSTNEDDDEGLGYGEWAPSPLKPRQTPENNWSGSEEDEKKEDDAIQEIKRISPKLQPASSEKEEEVTKEEVQPETRLDEVSTSRPTQSQRCFDNKLQLSESHTDGEIEEASDKRASNTVTRTHQAAIPNVENILLDGNLQMLRSRIWKGLILLLCIIISCELLSIAIIARVRLSYAELSSDVNEAWVPEKEPTMKDSGADEVSWSSREEKEEVINVEQVEIEDVEEESDDDDDNEEEAEPATDNVQSSEAEIVNEEHYDTKEGGSTIELQQNELVKVTEDAAEGGEQPEIEVSMSPEEERESSESSDKQPSAQEDKASASDFSLETEENFSISEEVTVSDVQIMTVSIIDEQLDANSALNLSANEASGDELDANERAEEVLPVEANEEVREDIESNDTQPSVIQDEELESVVDEIPEPEGILPSVEEEREEIECNDDQPNSQEDEGSESASKELPEADNSKLGAEEEHMSPSKIVLINEATVQTVSVAIDEELGANSTIDSSGNDGFGDELDAYEHADTDLVESEITMEDEEAELVITLSVEARNWHERDSLSVEEVVVGDKQPATNIHDVAIPSSEPESVENEHAQTELNEKETTMEDGSDQSKPNGSPSFDDNNHDDNYQEENEDVRQQVLPRTVETKREYLASLAKFEDVFETYEVIDALIGHVVCVIPRLLLKGILGAAMKVKERFSKKQ